MAKRLHLVDTCIIIDCFRGQKYAIDLLNSLSGTIVISAVTAMELYRGAKTKEKKIQVEKQIKAYHLAILDKSISDKAITLMKKYINGMNDLKPGDCLIAATALVNKLPLHTRNVSDFEFIEGLVLNP